MKKKSILVSILSILVVIGTFSFCIYENNKSKLVDVTANVTEDFSALSNKKICWGIKRSDNHEQPDVGKENKRIIDKMINADLIEKIGKGNNTIYKIKEYFSMLLTARFTTSSNFSSENGFTR